MPKEESVRDDRPDSIAKLIGLLPHLGSDALRQLASELEAAIFPQSPSYPRLFREEKPAGSASEAQQDCHLAPAS